MEDEVKRLYERVLENVTLYNQYENNVDFTKAYEISRMLLRINNMAIKNGLYRGDIKASLEELEALLKSHENNKPVYFI